MGIIEGARRNCASFRAAAAAAAAPAGVDSWRLASAFGTFKANMNLLHWQVKGGECCSGSSSSSSSNSSSSSSSNSSHSRIDGDGHYDGVLYWQEGDPLPGSWTNAAATATPAVPNRMAFTVATSPTVSETSCKPWRSGLTARDASTRPPEALLRAVTVRGGLQRRSLAEVILNGCSSCRSYSSIISSSNSAVAVGAICSSGSGKEAEGGDQSLGVGDELAVEEVPVPVPVVICGAGPTGLTLSLLLAKYG
ncbi:hypothetical protein Vafri_12562, partial [Volvox africanus]